MRALTAILTLVFSLAACADEPAAAAAAAAPSFEAGVHYAVIDTPARTSDPSKIEVTEVFWYGCGHCFRFEPVVQQWKSKAADDINFVHSPAMWNKLMELHARAFYAAKALGVADKLHQPLFNALNLERRKLQNSDELAELFVAQGVEKDAFLKAFNSFGVTSQVKQADARARSYRITGTPELVVDGKYRVSAKMAGGQDKMLEVVDYLISKVRTERS